MDPATAISAAKTAIGAGQIAYKGWGAIRKWRYGSVLITHPQNRASVRPEWVEIEGTHKNAMGPFWLVTARANKYWPQCRVMFHPDGRWSERINTGRTQRSCTVLLVSVTEFMHTIFDDIKDRSTRATYWGPIEMTPPRAHFSVVQALTLNVEIPSP